MINQDNIPANFSKAPEPTQELPPKPLNVLVALLLVPVVSLGTAVAGQNQLIPTTGWRTEFWLVVWPVVPAIGAFSLGATFQNRWVQTLVFIGYLGLALGLLHLLEFPVITRPEFLIQVRR